VRIVGEAYLEVSHNKASPFKVNIQEKSVIEVLGTHFNVSSYSDDDAIKTTLLEGRVRVYGSSSGADTVMLSPGQQAVQSDEGKKTVIRANANLSKVMAWKNGLFNFEDAGLEEVLQQLKRWYDLDIMYEGKIKEIRFFGEMNRNVPLSVVLEALQGLGVHF